MVTRRLLVSILSLLATALVFSGGALASGGNYVFQGGTPAEQQTVTDATRTRSPVTSATICGQSRPREAPPVKISSSYVVPVSRSKMAWLKTHLALKAPHQGSAVHSAGV